MKKLLFALALTLVSTNALAWGMSLESVTSWGQETIDPVRYNVGTAGNDVRVYEWVTPTQPHQKCVFVASENDTNFHCDLIENPDDIQPRELLGE